MKRLFNKIINILKSRDLILIVITLTIGIIYIITLFDMQIINGKEAREKSEKRILRNQVITATRGEIYDRNGVVLATNKLSFDVLLYRVKSTNEELNNVIYELIKILESNLDSIYSTFPSNLENNDFNFSSKEAEIKWKNEMKINNDLNYNQTIDYYINKYELSKYTKNDAINILKVRYEASLMGFSLFKSATIAKDISEKSLAIIEEKKFMLYGVDTVSVPKRYYKEPFLFSHTLRIRK
jgi:penicillin-binding protein 2